VGSEPLLLLVPERHPLEKKTLVEFDDLKSDGTRRHIRAALDAGATRDEILFVLKCASVMSIHSC
jgi:hypothetical protein